ncbi:class I SAM-dependent methyltransferase [Roseicyclus persicicus]|uniref:Class I SAM-dependent methyltransferase n=1 Tax=Roseicyclus persicicus TaxID=2650661 RepID=A0A7X6H359_9RHOB|nr:class I SAM-dependent methyltransferase [Roseibacterium persicicum]NKX45922.1 class I SAM-dependent methyltransferase [Roseibacterium persicicum]
MPLNTSAPVSSQLDPVWPAPAARSSRPDWSAYATAYDLLSEHNPAYQAILRDFEAFLATIDVPRVIYDVGGGSGNYTRIAAEACPDSEICLVEPDPGMIRLAQAKLARHRHVRYDPRPLEQIEAQGSADLIVCVHALYAMPDPGQRLDDLRRLLRPGGLLYLVDLGRLMNVTDWRSYLFAHLRREHGLLGALRIFWQGREIARQNQAILKAQKAGVYWTHSADEMAEAVRAAGFEVLRQQTVYRDYSDLLVCRARP